MNRLARLTATAVAVAVSLALAIPGSAQQTPQDMVPFKATLKGPVPPVGVVTLDPPLAYCALALTGDAAPLGAVQFHDHHVGQLGPDGVPRNRSGVGVFTAANGDAIFVSFSGLAKAGSIPGVAVGEEAFFVIGGRGRFAGATGAGILTWVFDPVNKKEVTESFDGMVSRPKL